MIRRWEQGQGDPNGAGGRGSVVLAVRGRHAPKSHHGWRPSSRNPTPAGRLLSMSEPFTKYAYECQDFSYLIHIFSFKKDLFLFRVAPFPGA